LPVTVYLATYSLLISIFVGVPLGVVAAVRRGKWVDRLASMLAVVVLSMPSFWLGLNLIFIFAVELRWLPSSGFTPLSEGVVASIKSLTLPAISLGMVQAALITRMTRSSMLDVLGQDYTRTARAKGLPERIVIYRHALKNAMIPTLTVIGLVVGILLGGAVIIEEVFSLPGIGQLVVTAVTRRDYPTVQGAIFFVAFMYLIVNQLVDVAYRLVDPRIKYGR
jgi:peptide/nickel transport system permease protein